MRDILDTFGERSYPVKWNDWRNMSREAWREALIRRIVPHQEGKKVVAPEQAIYAVRGETYINIRGTTTDTMILTDEEFTQHGGAVLSALEQDILEDTRIKHTDKILGIHVTRLAMLAQRQGTDDARSAYAFAPKYIIECVHAARKQFGDEDTQRGNP